MKGLRSIRQIYFMYFSGSFMMINPMCGNTLPWIVKSSGVKADFQSSHEAPSSSLRVHAWALSSNHNAELLILIRCKPGLEFYRGNAAIAVEREQNAVDHCGNDGNFMPYSVIFILLTVHYYFDTWIQMLIKSCVNHYFSLSFLRKNTLKKYVDMFLACQKSKGKVTITLLKFNFITVIWKMPWKLSKLP
jgi:hypothetical protein